MTKQLVACCDFHPTVGVALASLQGLLALGGGQSYPLNNVRDFSLNDCLDHDAPLVLAAYVLFLLVEQVELASNAGSSWLVFRLLRPPFLHGTSAASSASFPSQDVAS